MLWSVFAIACSPQSVECVVDRDCDNDLFCDGQELCKSGQCTSGVNPCSGIDNAFCEEHVDGCLVIDDCFEDADCDDQEFCNGVELCSLGVCISGVAPCKSASCDEELDICF